MKKTRSIFISLFWCILTLFFPIASGIIVSIKNLETVQSILVQAAFMALGFLIALLIIILSKRKIKEEYLNCNKRSILIYLPSILILIPTAIYGFTWKGADYFFATLFLYLFVGITEEIFFRYFIIEELKKSFHEKYTMLIGSLIFGLGHAAVAFSGTDFMMTVLTIINALIFGFMAIVLIINSQNIIPLMLIHFLFDFESKFILLEGNALAVAEFIRGFLMLAYAIFILISTNKRTVRDI